ncbi:ATP-binding protein [Desulfogranum japonicum]|uniref:ATP-binding protein n=1 Tax=Desulfogranum japonicum TaxID=231447 RepID=UPI00040045E4|nr:ATP-binding protein [Desulfogranum japonicum]
MAIKNLLNRTSLQAKTMFFISLVIFLFISLTTVFYVRDFHTNYLQAIEWRSVSLAQSLRHDISSKYQVFGGIADTDLLLEAAYLQCRKLYLANRDMHVAFVSLLSRDGTVITHNDSSLWGDKLEYPVLLKALQSAKISTVHAGGFYHTLVPILDEESNLLAVIDVGFPRTIVDQKIGKSIQKAILFCLLFFILVSLLVGLFIRHLVARPIDRFVQATADIARGDLLREIYTDETPEFKALSMSLQHMRDSIRENLEALERKNQQVKALIACSPVGLFSLDLAGGVVIWSESAERLFGWHAEEIVGRSLPTIPEQEQAQFDTMLKQIYNGHMLMGVELLQERMDGSNFHASLSGAPIRDDRGRIIGIMWAVEDISERMEREKEHADVRKRLAQVQQLEAIGRLAGGVAHDYNNTLGVILGYSELLLNKLDKDDPKRENVKRIIEATRHSADITRQLLTFARKQTVEPQILHLNEQVDHTLKMLHRLIGENIQVDWCPAEDLGLVKVDPTQVNQILANLCINARDAMKQGGKITIETRNILVDEKYCGSHPDSKCGEFVCLIVSDTGIGMDREILDKIFEPFFTTKGKFEGTGLGLATVYGIVKQNNGFVNVYSEPGKGSKFSVYFPLYHGKFISKRPFSDTGPVLGQGERILLVEDEESMLKLSHHILEELGYTVFSADRPLEAIELVEKEHLQIDLLLTDVILPDMNGRELAEQLSTWLPGLKTLYVSGYTANVIADSGILEDGVSFLAKPFSQDELARKVREVLAA